MERRRIHPAAPYSFLKRRSKQKSVFYARFRDPGTGQRLSAVSTGCARRDDAVRWCENYLEELRRAAEEAKEGPEHITFAEFAENFWNTKGTYAQSRVAHLYTCSRGYLDIAESNTRNHLIPVWGGYRLRDLTPGKIDLWVARLCRWPAMYDLVRIELQLWLRVLGKHLAPSVAGDVR